MLFSVGSTCGDGDVVCGGNSPKAGADDESNLGVAEIVCHYQCYTTIQLIERHLWGDPYNEQAWSLGVAAPGWVQATALNPSQKWCVR